jgi:hypothetical protein
MQPVEHHEAHLDIIEDVLVLPPQTKRQMKQRNVAQHNLNYNKTKNESVLKETAHVLKQKAIY